MESGTPKFLGKQASEPTDELDTFRWNMPSLDPPTVTFKTDEFTHLCPVTNQPDFGSLEISYKPRLKLAETKSLKLYLFGFRDRKSFDEMLVTTIAWDLYSQLEPDWLTVTGRFKSRGGISLTAVKHISRPAEEKLEDK